ncbi:uncharacterized protein L969DRAFT_95970 [Mixia osmundae IAM 14324]|uniref:Uncharacterized protein n=1 Tax=Mixia osmundae (strain CBS 9802 / IAM 14324 / JCM 22182 / KY 12970) TaxID=764103 RepID=G7DWV7_MIXOS|nr:uncharacterized protein L969DRAFT_55580 [Mixia osmundae IAM 14324]XP_014566700.1 uncharacterized protein L969DRAFT_95970 [Mixia osmundae IAM 14324]KEI36169.1 hypothetical protein L969DRAFT_55580 [Mixia osmundae IAM 14324]KEI38137.1 hypothetical protein L969DRAFT_95970 [Mixia osmundae IAM 14324]GAA95054.1 hypothetical protein E5Q_01709 [Mixia osmundae IAM 14324]
MAIQTDAGTAQPGFPRLTRADVLQCQFSAWYPDFRRLSPKATVVRLPEDFRRWLESDGLILPEGSGDIEDDDSDSEAADASDTRSNDQHTSSARRDLEEADEDIEEVYSFPQVDTQLRAIIDKYDGLVFPKLNWSSPKDAAWILPGKPLACSTPADIYLLLKSSDFIAHDLDYPFEHCFDEHDHASTPLPPPPPPLELVLKQWFEMPHSQEFRCFVSYRKLQGICQRDHNHFDFLDDAALQDEIKLKIAGFIEEQVLLRFPLAHFVCDVYLTRDRSRVFVVDLNPYGPQTDALLFSWEELNRRAFASATAALAPAQTNVELRLVDSALSRSAAMPSYSMNRYPIEVVGLSEGKSIAEFAQKFNSALQEATDHTEAST